MYGPPDEDEQPTEVNAAPILHSPRSSRPLAVLVLCDEWSPHSGGISQFNRKLCIALGQIGQDVTCAVTRADSTDHRDAAHFGVNLVVPTLGRYLNDLRAPLSGQPAFDAVIGHDRVSGRDAAFRARTAARHSVLVQIVHTCPDETAPFASVPSRTGHAEQAYNELQALCSQADVVCAPGPQIARKTGTMLDDGFGAGQNVVRLDPGPETGRLQRQWVPGPEAICLFLGRAQAAAVKGLDLAAYAVAEVRQRGWDADNAVLWIRGAPPGQGDATMESQSFGPEQAEGASTYVHTGPLDARTCLLVRT